MRDRNISICASNCFLSPIPMLLTPSGNTRTLINIIIKRAHDTTSFFIDPNTSSYVDVIRVARVNSFTLISYNFRSLAVSWNTRLSQTVPVEWAVVS